MTENTLADIPEDVKRCLVIYAEDVPMGEAGRFCGRTLAGHPRAEFTKESHPDEWERILRQLEAEKKELDAQRARLDDEGSKGPLPPMPSAACKKDPQTGYYICP